MKISPLFLIATTFAQETTVSPTTVGDYQDYSDIGFARGKRNKKKKQQPVVVETTVPPTPEPTTVQQTTAAPDTTVAYEPTTVAAVETTFKAATIGSDYDYDSAERGKKNPSKNNYQNDSQNNYNQNNNKKPKDPYNNNDNYNNEHEHEHYHEHNWDGDEHTKPIDEKFKKFADKEGQTCYTCNGVDYEDCYSKGSYVDCDDHQGSCLLEVRHHKGKMVGLQMGCHQPQSCLMQQWQNFNSRKWQHNQCKTAKNNKKYSVCRLCSQKEDGFQSIDWQDPDKMSKVFRDMHVIEGEGDKNANKYGN